MSYSRVTVQVPNHLIPPQAFGKTTDIRADFLPMGSMDLSGQPPLCSDFAIFREKLAPYNLQMMQWLQTPEHAVHFYQDPLAAFREAVSPPEELVSMLNGLKPASPPPEKADSELMQHLQQEISSQFASQLQDVTEGWDVVIGMRQDAVNKALKYAYDKEIFPHHYSGEFKIFEIIPIKISADLASLTMTAGTGSHITIALAFSKIELTLAGELHTFSNVVAKLSLNLRKIKSPVQPSTGTRYDFLLDIANTDAFLGLQLENLPPEFDPSALEVALLSVLRKQCAGKTYKIFSVDVQAHQEIAFLVPSEVEYAGQSSSGHLPAIGALLQTKDGNKGAEQLNVNLFPENSNSVMVMSRDLFLKNVGLTALANAFHISPSVFAYHSDQHYVYNTSSFNYYEKVKGYTVAIKSVTLKIENGQFTLNMTAHVEPSAGIYIDYYVNAPYTATIIDSDSKQSIHFELDSEHYRESHEVNAEWWVWLLAFLAIFIGTLIVAIILSVIDATAPKIGADVFASAIQDVNWNHLDIVKLNSIEMGNCLRIGCTAEFKS